MINTTLCKYCIDVVVHEISNHDIFEEGDVLNDIRLHHPTLTALSESATTCPLCAALLKGIGKLPNIHQDNGSATIETSLEVTPSSFWTGRLELLKHNIVAKKLRGVNDSIPDISILIKRNYLTIHHDSDFQSLWGIKNAPVNLDGLTSRAIWQPQILPERILDQRLETVRSWISECRNNHPKCMTNKKRFRLPTRLLDVSEELGFENIRLVDVQHVDSPEALLYNTLSHCWGNDSHSNSRTTKENEAERRKAIKLDALPKTYRDAIAVTRKLGIRYLWIDSLCIIQDDPNDWERESSRMHSVFGGSFLTLAATDAEDSSIGLFLSTLEPPLELRLLPNDLVASVRCPAANLMLLHESVLNSRMWVFQELILSTRTVHFTQDQFIWQCQTLLLSEDGSIQDDKVSSVKASGRYEPLDFCRLDVACRYWWKWIEDYSARKLTKHGDLLAASAGITEYFMDETGLTPCLGLWEENLIHDLAWTVCHQRLGNPNRQINRSEIPNVPSWSWLHYGTLIKHTYAQWAPLPSKIYTNVLNLNIHWKSVPLTSPIESTRLVLSGPIKRLQFHFEWDNEYSCPVLILLGQEERELSMFHPDQRIELDPGQEIFTAPCLALSAYDRGFTNKTINGSHFGVFLALREVRSEAGQWPQYERLGVGGWDASPSKEDHFEGVENSTIELV